ncbi:MAG TPA: Gfo/Idh/MocA family oxidoreductase, partial [Thermaerobacter sp.]
MSAAAFHGARQGPWRLGLAGAGAFGAFILEALAPLPEVTLAAVAARTPARRQAAIRRWAEARRAAALPVDGVAEVEDARDLCRHPDVDVVAVATPPDLQPEVALAAVAAGKPIFLEKPGALRPDDLAEVARRAEASGVPAAMDFVMRASPILERVRVWYRSGWLGAPERWHVENWAGGELPTGHWFWDPGRSGGVLVEHGVHFLDEVAWVLEATPGRAWSQAWPHPRLPGAMARWLAAVEYEGVPPGDAPSGGLPSGGAPSGAAPAASTPSGAAPAGSAPSGTAPAGSARWHLVATFYHAFVRPEGQEHQVRELGFRNGWIRISGWIPERLEG